MKKYEILYDWPIDRITNLCDSAQTEAFVNSLDEDSEDQSELLKYIDAFRAFRADLADAKAGKRLFAKWGEIRKLVDALHQRYPQFPDLHPDRFRLTLLLAEKLSESLPPPAGAPANPQAPDFDEAELNEQLFELRAPIEPLPIHWFVRQNAQSFEDSVAIFNSSNVTVLTNDIAASAISPEFLFQILAALHTAPQIPAPQVLLIKRLAPPIDISAVDAFAKLQLLASGKAVHLPKQYTAPPHVVDVDGIRAGTPYHQLNEVFYVMSEYNSHHDLLSKYLSLYHVFENFMFKLPIVELERRRNGQMFSIRDFRRLYQELDVRELTALKKLMAVVLDFEPIAGTRFKALIEDRWQAFCPAADIAKLNAVLERLGVRRGEAPLNHADFCGDHSSSYFAQIVYAVRNVIVHNTETEWHLSYATLDEMTGLMLEGFLLPSLEEICFALVGRDNQHVWYQNKALNLYQ